MIEFDYVRFRQALVDQYVLGKNRFKACEDNEDDHGASSEAGYCAGINKAIELFDKYLPSSCLLEDPNNE